jgi:hypothetical protein
MAYQVIPSVSKKVVGIDFSGAKDAGNHIWMSTGTKSGGHLRIDHCVKAKHYFGCQSSKNKIYDELVNWIDSSQNITIGIDFPFSVPETVANVVFNANTWKEMANNNIWMNIPPKTFRDQCKNVDSSQLRDTDAMNRADCPYSIRVYKQTYNGIKNVLRPLLQQNISIAPIINTSRDVTILETYPAATLAREKDLFASQYKNGKSALSRREHNIRVLSQRSELDISGISYNKVINNESGDALDSIVASLATYRATNTSSLFNHGKKPSIEGKIFV